MNGERLLAYHEASKHRLDRYAPGPGRLDWATQPDPFRVYADAPRVELPLCADRLEARYNDVRRGARADPAPIDRDSIATLLELSLGLSAWKSYHGTSWALRCNPSSGNLHPTEGYIVTCDVPDLQRGVYHYVSRDHALERRAALGTATALTGGILLGLASIYWREAWKYGVRAFRYCQHDCGHAIAAVAYAAAALGWRTQLVVEASDAEIAQLIGVDREADFAHAEREAPDCLVWVGTAEPPPLETIAALVHDAHWAGRANRLSPSHVHWSDIEVAHEATLKPRLSTSVTRHRSSAPPSRVARLDLLAATIIRGRRSAVDFDGVTAIDVAAFYTMLEPLLPRAGVPPWDIWPEPPRVHLALFLHRVEGLEPGLYILTRDPEATARMKQAMSADWLWRKCGPSDLDLYLLTEGDAQDVARTVSCHQDIAADGCFAVAMLADFALVRDEPWRYRALHWECGIIGQVLYLEAEAAGIRATGIGCFFDDALHQLLGLQVASDATRAWQTLYHFTVGGAVDDARLTTLPPYRGRPPAAST